MSTQPTQPVALPAADSLSREEIADKVIGVIANTKQLSPEAVRPENTLEELGIDSLDRLNILFDLEGAFNISINDEQARQVRTVAEMIAGIELLVTGGAARGQTPEIFSARQIEGSNATEPGGEPLSPDAAAAPDHGASSQSPAAAQSETPHQHGSSPADGQ